MCPLLLTVFGTSCWTWRVSASCLETLPEAVEVGEQVLCVPPAPVARAALCWGPRGLSGADDPGAWHWWAGSSFPATAPYGTHPPPSLFVGSDSKAWKDPVARKSSLSPRAWALTCTVQPAGPGTPGTPGCGVLLDSDPDPKQKFTFICLYTFGFRERFLPEECDLWHKFFKKQVLTLRPVNQSV